MTGTTRTAVHLWAVAGSLTLAGCGGDPGLRTVQVDTLADGSVRVHNAGPPPEPESVPRAVETLRLGSLGAGPTEFGRIVGLAVHPTTGHLYVLDSQNAEVRVFDGTGAHVRTFGSEGAGPGEIRSPTGLVFDPDGALRVIDLGNARYSRFTDEGEPAGTIRRSVAGRLPGCCGHDAAGRMLDPAVGIGQDRITYRAIFRIDSAGEPVDTLPLPQAPVEERYFDLDGPVLLRIPWTPGYHWTFAPGGETWQAHGGAYRLARVTLAGDTVRLVTMEADPVPVGRSERDRVETRLDSLTDGAVRSQFGRIPGMKPYIRGLYSDSDGRVWVRRATAGGSADTSLFDVFTADGVYQRSLRIPADVGHPLVIAGGVFYAAVETDGVPQVVGWEIRRP